jgi:hypothetical protein
MSMYEKRIAQELEAWSLESNGDGSGKRQFDLACSIFKYSSSDSSAENGIFLARTVFPKLIKHIDKTTGFDILTSSICQGLLDHSGWKVLFENLNSALTFVVTVIRFIEDPGDNDYMCSVRMRLKLADAMAEWIGADFESEEPSVREITEGLFGEVWCTTVYDSCESDESIADLIILTKPTFLPGRIMYEIDLQSEILPDLMY